MSMSGHHHASSIPDVQLMESMAKGNVSAFSTIYDRYSAQFFGLSLKILKNRLHAEDVIQEVFVNIWKKAYTYNRSKGTPVAWMTILCRNKCIDVLRVQEKRKSRTAFWEEDLVQRIADDTSPNPLEKASLAHLNGLVNDAMLNLPAEQKDLIEMSYFGGYSQSEIAEKLSMPLGTVKTRMRLGMIKLKTALSEVINDSQI